MENEASVNITINIYCGNSDSSVKIGDKNKIDHSSIGENEKNKEKES
ncbi:hypothetical protein JZO66_10860 [Enterococcus sp. DIV0242_7C1]|uniref:Uncharacterized protein n=1 Tax=Candidatus Enterococcus dunnyi TaxID=1834192 RepID=A0A200JC28_9ENTE|nr:MULTISPECIES: hypothetical protein [unclassified Enterococcus]MBO0471045.1 hypothetical protein [Enterococcus sp. DIV0242_7C1]OUZ34782.1 hypothetical protein A5889_000257 [Enterococcus sp. 9D6_DIV0238]